MKSLESAGKRYVCIDLEMTEFSAGQRGRVPGANGEVIQFGAVMLDENYNMIGKFSSYVKPDYSSVTAAIEKLTGITNRALENADGFMTVFDKFCYWRGDGDITTFCWSKADYNQLWAELQVKGRHRMDLSFALKNFVDLQELFGKLVRTKTLVGLEAAVKLLQMEYEGQIHTAYSDSYNTARILHKLFCTEGLELEVEFLNPTDTESAEKEEKPAEYRCSFASFMPPELLARFGYESPDESDEVSAAWDDANEDCCMEETENIEDQEVSSLNCICGSEIACLCSKYKIEPGSWLKLAVELSRTDEMQVA